MITFGKGPLNRSFLIRPADIGLRDVVVIGRMVLTAARVHSTKHVHDSRRLEIIYVANGRQRYRVGRRIHRVQAGDVLVVFPNETHAKAGPLEERGVIYYVVLNVPPGNNTLLRLNRTESAALRKALLNLCRCFHGSRSMQTLLDDIAREYPATADNPLAALAVRNHLLAFLLETIRRSNLYAGRRRPARLRQLLELIDRRLDDPLPVSHMAHFVGLSPSHFKTVFKAETGLAPADYVRRHRVDRARQLLRQSDARSITDIALSLGFSSSQNFATIFRRYAGISPSRFRSASPGSRR